MIRPATSADVPAIRALETCTATAAHWSEQEYQRVFDADPPRLVLVADEDGVHGFLIARRVAAEWELENIVVGPGRQRRGLGSALVRHLLDVAQEQGGQSIFLEVRESNAAARALYGKQGFAEVGRRPRYYQQPEEDAVLYRRVIGGGVTGADYRRDVHHACGSDKSQGSRCNCD